LPEGAVAAGAQFFVFRYSTSVRIDGSAVHGMVRGEIGSEKFGAGTVGAGMVTAGMAVPLDSLAAACRLSVAAAGAMARALVTGYGAGRRSSGCQCAGYTRCWRLIVRGNEIWGGYHPQWWGSRWDTLGGSGTGNATFEAKWNGREMAVFELVPVV
jgi:hypothetical protein